MFLLGNAVSTPEKDSTYRLLGEKAKAQVQCEVRAQKQDAGRCLEGVSRLIRNGNEERRVEMSGPYRIR
jgi:hypothetical protein